MECIRHTVTLYRIYEKPGGRNPCDTSNATIAATGLERRAAAKLAAENGRAACETSAGVLADTL